MKTDHSKRGIALVVMLSCMVMVTVIVVVFLNSMRTELVISTSTANAESLKPLADTCANIVISQIQTATKAAASQSYAWASQPGMIRVFNNTTGALENAYKLYSSDQMVAQTVDPAAEISAFASWDQKPALFTDLNVPRNGVYPIVNPGAASGSNSITGFSLDTAPGSSSNAAAMPGRWIYVLQDGALVVPTLDGDGNTVSVSGASKDNPITGRIAFWADDETCKVNINTASEGTYWDAPRFQGTTEQNFASYQPAQKEYQRYPGHPATVSLSTVFPTLTRDQIYSIVPRIVGGGSDGGTKQVTRTPLSPDSDRLYATVDELIFANDRSINPIPKDALEKSRFFLTASSRSPELNLFGMPRVSVWPVNVDLATNPGSLYTTPYDRLAAFCSTYGGSSSPKRYYIQRKDSDSPTADYNEISRNRDLFKYIRTLMGKSIPGFGGSFAGKYGDCRDSIAAEMFDYIRCVNLVDENLSSTILYDYFSTPSLRYLQYPLRTVVKTPPVYQYTVPYFRYSYNGADYLCGWPGSGQVAPITIDQNGTKLNGFGRFNTISEIALHLICCADGNGLSPSEAGSSYDPRTVSNIATSGGVLLKDENGNSVDATYTKNGASLFPENKTLQGTTLGKKQKRLQAALLLEMFTPAQGSAGIFPDMKVSVSGLNNLGIGGQHPFPASANGTLSYRYDVRISGSMIWGGINGFRGLGTWMKYDTIINGGRYSRWYVEHQAASTPGYQTYWFVSDPFTVNLDADGNIVLDGNPDTDITIKTYTGATSYDDLSTPADKLVQTIQCRFPSTTIPTPDLIQYTTIGNTSVTASGTTATDIIKIPDLWEYNGRINPAGRSTTGFNSGAYPQRSGCVIRIDPDVIKNSSTNWRFDEANDPIGHAWNTNKWSSRSDVVRSLVPKNGDSRLIAGLHDVPRDLWIPHPDYKSSSVKLAHILSQGQQSGDIPWMSSNCKIIQGASYPSTRLPDIPPGTTSAEATGDWDNGFAFSVDGAYINKPDDGSIYYDGNEQTVANFNSSPLTATPNRIIPSAGMFGSLPTGINAVSPADSVPWQTLLFRPQPSHPQSKQSRPAQPPDHLVMDLFAMPVVEPYAISEPFSTAGKINLNYQILPYSYIHRSTALQAAIKSERMIVVPTTAATSYKTNTAFGSVRYAINTDAADSGSTLRQFEEKFKAGDIFRSATELCDIYLVPSGQSWTSDSSAVSFWNNQKLTGDNARERPYAALYAKLTTRSNSYQVYYCVQALKKTPSGQADQWNESRDSVTAEQRGTYLLQRFLDPNDTTLPDPATSTTPASLDDRYQFRILNKAVMDF